MVTVTIWAVHPTVGISAGPPACPDMASGVTLEDLVLLITIITWAASGG